MKKLLALLKKKPRRAEPRRERKPQFEGLESRLALSAGGFVPTFDAALERLDAGAALVSVQAYSDYPIAQWSIDWGDGTVETVDALGDSLTRAHYYPDSDKDIEYHVTLQVVDAFARTQEDPIEIAAFLVDAALESPTFVTDVFYDAEKGGYDQSGLCWGAAAANVLVYTGWADSTLSVDAGGNAVEFENEDDVYEYVVDNFDNYGSSALYAYQWFLTGEYAPYGADGWAQPNPGSGGFYSTELSDIGDAVNYYSYASSKAPETILGGVADALREGSGATVSLAFYATVPGSTLKQAHTISLWGYEYDANYSPDDPRYYSALIVSDSDDDQYHGREAENALATVNIEWSEAFGRYRLTDYPSGECWIEEFITLRSKEAVLG